MEFKLRQLNSEPVGPMKPLQDTPIAGEKKRCWQEIQNAGLSGFFAGILEKECTIHEGGEC